MKVFISQPMNGRTNEEILAEREYLENYVKSQFDDVEIADSYFKGFEGKPLAALAKSLEALSECDAAIFASGWRKARGCRIERICCTAYGIQII